MKYEIKPICKIKQVKNEKERPKPVFVENVWWIFFTCRLQ